MSVLLQWKMRSDFCFQGRLWQSLSVHLWWWDVRCHCFWKVILLPRDFLHNIVNSIAVYRWNWVENLETEPYRQDANNISWILKNKCSKISDVAVSDVTAVCGRMEELAVMVTALLSSVRQLEYFNFKPNGTEISRAQYKPEFLA